MQRAILLAAALAATAGFTPFSVVQNVCPACPPPPADVVELVSGATIRCTLVAENPDYYIAERHGERRAILKRNVKRIIWRGAPAPKGTAAAGEPKGAARPPSGTAAGAPEPRSGPPRALPTGDQVVMVNGVALVGRITRAEPARLFQIQVGPHLHTVWRHAIAAVYRGGQRVPLPAAATAPPATGAQPAPAPTP